MLLLVLSVRSGTEALPVHWRLPSRPNRWMARSTGPQQPLRQAARPTRNQVCMWWCSKASVSARAAVAWPSALPPPPMPQVAAAAAAWAAALRAEMGRVVSRDAGGSGSS